jgi:hypothetical protein
MRDEGDAEDDVLQQDRISASFWSGDVGRRGVAHLGAFAFYKRRGVWHSVGSDQSGSDLFRARGLCPWPLLFLLGLQPREDVDQGFVAPVDEGFQPRNALLVE